MTLSIRSKTALFMAASLAAAVAGATSASAEDDPFRGCQEAHWNAFGDAVGSNDPVMIQDFMLTFGPACLPLEETAAVLLCELNPAACLAAIEPAAEPEPEYDRPVDNPQTESLFYDPFYRGPGMHLGWENGSGDTEHGEPSQPSSAPSAPAPDKPDNNNNQ